MRLLLICIMLTSAFAALPKPPPLTFSANLLSNFGNDSFALEGHSLVQLPNNAGFIATGSIKSPSGLRLTDVLDAPDVAHGNTTSRLGLIARISPTGAVLWARRTCALPAEAKLHAAVSPSGGIFIAGARLVGGSSESFLVLARYDANGTQTVFNDHGRGKGLFYTGIVASGNESVFLVAHVEKGNLSNSVGGDGAIKGSVAVIQAYQGNGTVKRRVTITQSMNNTTESEKPEGVAISVDAKTLYLLTRRVTVVKGKYNKSDSVSALNTTDLAGPPVGHMNIDYGYGNGAKIGVIGDNVYVAQIVAAGSANKLRVIRLGGMGCNVSNSLGCDVKIISKAIPHPDSGQLRIAPTIAGILKAPPHLKVIFSSQSDANDTDHEEKGPLSEELNNMRPSVVDLKLDDTFSASATADTGRATEASAFVALGDDTLVFGTDMHDINKTKLYLAVVRGVQYHSNKTLDPRTATDKNETGSKCIGVGSTVRGTSITDVIDRASGIRKQRHPLRKLRVLLRLERDAGRTNVMCFSEHGSRVCTTSGHVLFVHGVPRYMRDICRQRVCEEEMQHIVNFKGDCGSHVLVHQGLAISMHAASAEEMAMGRTAHQVTVDECVLREKNWMRWFVSTQ